VVAVGIVVVVIDVAVLVSVFHKAGHSDPLVAPSVVFSFPPFPSESVRADQSELDWLRDHEVGLRLDSFGTAHSRKVEPARISGGFYSGSPLGASILVCYAATRPLETVVEGLDGLLRKNGWNRHNYAGYTISTIIAAIRNGEPLDTLNLYYSRAALNTDVV